MIVNSTDMKNSFGKYLMHSLTEDVIITKNGQKIAVLKNYEKENQKPGLAETSSAYKISPRRISYEEFLVLTKDTEERCEYIDGEIYYLSSPKTPHQTALMELTVYFYNAFKGKKCKPMIAPYDIKLIRSENDINVVQPDLMVICDLDEKLGEDGYYHGVPSLMLEILSDSTKSKDYIKKMNLYMQTGVLEYWIVNPKNKEVQVYCFENQNIKENITFKGDDIIKSYTFKEIDLKTSDIFI
jgi:Uma2 family endonuclease